MSKCKEIASASLRTLRSPPQARTVPGTLQPRSGCVFACLWLVTWEIEVPGTVLCCMLYSRPITPAGHKIPGPRDSRTQARTPRTQEPRESGTQGPKDPRTPGPLHPLPPRPPIPPRPARPPGTYGKSGQIHNIRKIWETKQQNATQTIWPNRAGTIRIGTAIENDRFSSKSKPCGPSAAKPYSRTEFPLCADWLLRQLSTPPSVQLSTQNLRMSKIPVAENPIFHSNDQ